ncbi:hypothetical protein RJ639_020742, partial [Escallonia herrerae]
MKKQAGSSMSSSLAFFFAVLTLISIVEGQSCRPSGRIRGRKPPPGQCSNQNDSDCYDTPVIALSTGWFNNRSRCLDFITIFGNGRSVRAKVVDECDSTMGCDSDHDFQPPCPNNIVDASRAVWKALGVPKNDW